MPESKQAKSRRLVTHCFNTSFASLDLGPIEPGNLRILYVLNDEQTGNWTIVLIMKDPLVAYWEVAFNKKGRFSHVRPYMPSGEFHYQDEPAPRVLKAVAK